MKRRMKNKGWFQILKSKLAFDQESGFGTIEVVIIIAVMLAVVLLFRTQISRFAAKLIDRVFSDSIIDSF